MKVDLGYKPLGHRRPTPGIIYRCTYPLSERREVAGQLVDVCTACGARVGRS